jgi:hypothetical protein
VPVALTVIGSSADVLQPAAVVAVALHSRATRFASLGAKPVPVIVTCSLLVSPVLGDIEMEGTDVAAADATTVPARDAPESTMTTTAIPDTNRFITLSC